MDTDVFNEKISKDFTVKQAKVQKDRKTLFKHLSNLVSPNTNFL